MGKSITPRYRVTVWEYTGTAQKHVMAWDCKSYGRPTPRNLERWIDSLQASYQTGGVNAHIANLYGCIPNVYKAQIETNELYAESVAQYYAPTFKVF